VEEVHKDEKFMSISNLKKNRDIKPRFKYILFYEGRLGPILARFIEPILY